MNRRVWSGLLLLGAATLVVVGASCKRPVDPRRVVMHDDGVLCLGKASDGDGADGGVAKAVDLRAGEALEITVRSPCLSNACATERSSKCGVKRDGNRVVVTSELTWIGPEEIGTPCPHECSSLDARCVTEALPAGEYKVVLGARTLDVTLPSHRDARCEGDAKVALAPPPVKDAGAALATPSTILDPSMVPAAPGTGLVVEPPPGDTLCIGPSTAGKSRALKTGQPIAVTLLHRNACVGASCTSAPGKCTVKRKGFNIVVNAQFPSSTTKPTKPCTEDCPGIAATCRTDALRAGTYTIDMGSVHRTLQIPAAAPPACGP